MMSDSGHSSPFAEDISTPPPAKRRLDRSPATESKRWKLESTGLSTFFRTVFCIYFVLTIIYRSRSAHKRQCNSCNIRRSFQWSTNTHQPLETKFASNNTGYSLFPSKYDIDSRHTATTKRACRNLLSLHCGTAIINQTAQ